MIVVHPQYIKDSAGKKSMVILPVKEFEAIMEALDDLEDVRLYDKAKQDDDGVRIPMSEVFKEIESKRKIKV